MWANWIMKIHWHLLLLLMTFTLPSFELNAGQHEISTSHYSSIGPIESGIAKCSSHKEVAGGGTVKDQQYQGNTWREAHKVGKHL